MQVVRKLTIKKMANLLQIQTTSKTKLEAEKVAQVLIEKKLSACVQILGPITSKYWWEGKIETSTEYLTLIKTTVGNFEKVKAIIKTNSSYELPEIIATEIIKGDEDYLAWFSKASTD